MGLGAELAGLVGARHDALRVACLDEGKPGQRYREAPWPKGQPERPYAVYLACKGQYFTLAFDLDDGPAVWRYSRRWNVWAGS